MDAGSMYDLNHVRDGLARRRQTQTAKPAKGQPMKKRTTLTIAEHDELKALIAAGATDPAIVDWGNAHHVNLNSYGAYVRTIKAALATAEPPLPPPIFQPPAVVFSPLPALQPAINVEASGPAAPALPANLDTVVNWLANIRALRDELREHGVTVEGTVSITIDL